MKTLPAVRESIEQKDWKLAEEQIVRVGKVLENTGYPGRGSEQSRAREQAFFRCVTVIPNVST